MSYPAFHRGRMAALGSISSSVPSDYSGLVSWVDLSDTSTLTVYNDNQLYKAVSKVGSHDYIQATVSARPLYSETQNGVVIARFDGVNDKLHCTTNLLHNATGVTVFVVGDGGIFTTYSGDYSGGFTRIYDATRLANVGGRFDNVYRSVISTNTTPVAGVAASAWGSGLLDIYLNGAGKASTAVGTNALTQIGAGMTLGVNSTNVGIATFVAGTLFELAVYNQKLSEADIIELSQSLMVKWGLI